MRLSGFVAAWAIAAASVSAGRIHPNLHRQLQQTPGTIDIVIDFKDNSALEALEDDDQTLDRGERIRNMVQHLDRANKETQQEVMNILNQEADDLVGEPTQLWITPSLFVKNASPRLIDEVSQLNSVAEVRLPAVISLDVTESTPSNQPVMEINIDINNGPFIEWGVQNVQAPKVWNAGFTGQNVIIANIDSGVRATHRDLRDNFVGLSEYGWYDPETNSSDPYDLLGHGTHTTGIMVGKDGIGVAPDAKWMACKLYRQDGSHELDAAKCAQFVLCPHDTTGKNANCSKAPHIVSNSWSLKQETRAISDALAAWQQAGIIAVFSAGNLGPGCSTVRPPATSTAVIGVGALANDDVVTRLSGRGPSKGGVIKPDISAPGAAVRSSSSDSDTSYATKTGTSMAVPHVAAVIALMKSANQSATFDDIKKSLYTGANTKTLVTPQNDCGRNHNGSGQGEVSFPNNVYGYGRVDAYRSIFDPASEPEPEPEPPTKVPVPPVDAMSSGFCSIFKYKFWCKLSLYCSWSDKDYCERK